MATSVITLPQVTITSGSHVIGTFSTGNNFTQVKLVLDVLGLTGPFAANLDASFDSGSTWLNLCGVSGSGPITAGTGSKGNLLNNWQMATSFGSVTNGATQVRVSVVNLAIFLSAGGTLTLT